MSDERTLYEAERDAHAETRRNLQTHANALHDEIASLRAALDASRAGHADTERELRAALAAEREAHAETRRSLFAEHEADAEMGARRGAANAVLSVESDVLREERDAAIARAETAERERDAFRAQAESSLVVPCACGRPMPSVQSRLRCDACRAEGERDEARAQVVAMRAALLAVWDASARGDAEKCPQDNNLDLTLAICATKTVTDAPDAGAPLLAELRALRAVRERILGSDEYAPTECHSEPEERVQYAWWVCSSCGEQHESDREKIEHRADCLWRMALDAAKGGG